MGASPEGGGCFCCCCYGTPHEGALGHRCRARDGAARHARQEALRFRQESRKSSNEMSGLEEARAVCSLERLMKRSSRGHGHAVDAAVAAQKGQGLSINLSREGALTPPYNFHFVADEVRTVPSRGPLVKRPTAGFDTRPFDSSLHACGSREGRA